MESPEEELDKPVPVPVPVPVQEQQEQDPLVGQTFEFERSGESESQSTSVTVERVIKEISGPQGFSDWVKLVECSVAGSTEGSEKEKKIVCVLKKLGGNNMQIDENDPGQSRRTRHLEKNLAAHKAMKELGLPVFPTFRINKEKGLILMTDGTSFKEEKEEKFLLSGNNRIQSLDYDFSLGEEKGFDIIDGFDEEVEDMFEKLERAQEAGWYIQGDTFGFFVNKKVFNSEDGVSIRQKMRIILFDFDQVAQRRPGNQYCQDNRVNFLYGLAGTNVPPWDISSLQIGFKPLSDGFLTYVRSSKREVYKNRAIELLSRRENLPVFE